MKAILVIDMPKSCDKCEVRCDGYTAKEYSDKGIKRPSWCPLKPLPNPITERGKWISEEYQKGWNAYREALGETEKCSTQKTDILT